MFEFFFQHPRSVFAKGDFVLLGSWPTWLLGALIAAVAVVLAILIRRSLPEATERMRTWRVAVVWFLQTAMAAILLFLLWHPALLVSELKPQQNIVAVVVDDSRSMALDDGGVTRHAKVVKALNDGVLAELQKKFQTRIYKIENHLGRATKLEDLKPDAPVTHINEGLKELMNETAGLPVGAVVFLSDGADNSGGIDLTTISAIRNRRIPVHTVGVGKEKATKDLEMIDAQVASRTLADARLAADVTFHQRGYAGRKAKISVKDGSKLLTSKEITLAPDGNQQTEGVMFNAGVAGAKTLQFSLDLLDGEENINNNFRSKLVNVESGKRKVLYFQGEMAWEYKFLRRALEDDRTVQVVSMERTAQNKLYRQGVDGPDELKDGFPTTVEDLFKYQALVIGSAEAAYFSTTQQELIKQFVDRRGGGLLLFAGRASFADGGWGNSSMAELLPVILPAKKGTFHRTPANVDLTTAGRDSIILRLVEDPTKNIERWKKMPAMADYQELGTPKPGATVLAEMRAGGKSGLPFLITQNFGRGRVMALGSQGLWRWQMTQALDDKTHEHFWQQTLRWLVSGTPGRVVVSTANQVLLDDGRIRINAEVRDKNYLPAADASVKANILGPEGIAAQIEMTPDYDTPGLYVADYIAEKQGSYVTEVIAKRGDEDAGRDVLNFQRMDGVAENFQTEQNRELLEKLSSQTGGRYWKPEELKGLSKEISYSEAGITIRDTKDLWNLPIVFMILIMLRASEWLLRRKWGIV